MLRPLLVSVCLLVGCAVSRADTLQYSFSQTYPNSPTHTFSFQVASQLSPQDVLLSPNQDYFGVKNVTATVDGVTSPYLVVFESNSGGAGGLVLSGPYYYQSQLTLTYFNASNLPLYSGSPNNPTLLTGTFSLREFGAPYGGALGTLTVTNLTTTVTPEPSSLLLLGTGLVGLTGMAWRKSFG